MTDSAKHLTSSFIKSTRSHVTNTVIIPIYKKKQTQRLTNLLEVKHFFNWRL